MLNDTPPEPEGGAPAPAPMRILLVDDHPIVRLGLVALLAQLGQPIEVHEADDAAGALALALCHQPRVALLDLSLSGELSLQLIARLREAAPGMAVLVVSMHDERVYADRVLRAGALGYVMKQTASQSIIQAIHTVCAGKVWLSGEMRDAMIDRMARRASPERQDKMALLSDRELQVFRLLGQGLKKADIALRLNLSPNTIETYRMHIKQKLSIASGAELYKIAFLYMQDEKSPPA